MIKFLTPPTYYKDSPIIRQQMQDVHDAANKLYAKYGISADLTQKQVGPEDASGRMGSVWMLAYRFNNGVWIAPATPPRAGMAWWAPGVTPAEFPMTEASAIMPNNWWRSAGQIAEAALEQTFAGSYYDYVLATTGKPAEWTASAPLTTPPPDWSTMPNDYGNPDQFQG